MLCSKKLGFVTNTLPTRAAHNTAGHATGVTGIILAFLGLGPIGLIFSLISTIQLARAGASKTLSVLGIVFNLLSIMMLGFFALVILSTRQ